VGSFYDSATFYRHFIQNFSNLVAPITNCLKMTSPFLWTEVADKALALIKDKLTNTPILAFHNFEKVFELESNACRVGIRAVLSQEKRPIVFIRKKLNEARQKCSTCE